MSEKLPYRRLSDPPRNRREWTEDRLVDLMVWLLRPVEAFHRWSWYRSFGKGKR